MSKLFGIRLRNLRTEKNLSQRGLAKILDVSQRIIGNWENNEAEPSTYKVSKIAVFFDVEMPYLYGFDTETVKRLIQICKGISEKEYATPDIIENENPDIMNTKEYEEICNIRYSKDTYSSRHIMRTEDNQFDDDD